VGRLPLEGRRAVYLVRVGRVVYVVGASEAGIAKLGEVDRDSIELPAAAHQNETFREVLNRAFGKKP
jgi:flagellar biogenesis protein FliO